MRIVVIGAGVGGLAVAARLAALGHRVTVFERSSTVGGKLARYTRHTPRGTFHFDTGPSLLTLPRVFIDLFADTGAPLSEYVELEQLDPVVRHVFADGATLDSHPDPDRMTAGIAAAFGADAAADWRRLWRRAERIWRVSWREVLSVPMDSPARLARLAWRVPDLAAVAPGRTLRGLGRTHLRDPRLRMLLDRYATYTGADPRRAPAALAAIPYAELTHGGWYVRGGLACLADALRRRCEELRVRIHTGAEVTAVEAPAGRVTAVRLAHTRIPADAVVSNVDPQVLYRDLLPTPRRLSRLSDRSVAGFVLLLGLTGRTADAAHHTVYFPDDYDAEFDAVFGDPAHGIPARPARDPAILVSNPTDPQVHPAGHESWFVLVNAPRHGQGLSTVDWTRPDLADAYADHVLDTLAARGRDIRPRILFQETRTPADLASTAAAPGGAIYGTAAHTLLRPAASSPITGLHLVGGGTHPGGGLPLVALSAHHTATRIGRYSHHGR